MSEIFIEDYIKKITYLEKKIGNKVNYTLLNPSLLQAYDIISIQNSAKQIAEFVNMKDYIFIVAFSKQKENVGGHIELKYLGKEVFIEISNKAVKFPEAILATLAHEITHKYIQSNNIAYGTNDYENEVFTDITTIFLGLGKLLLNGCDCQTVKFESEQTITETYKTGYLNKNQIAFVYLLICFMRNIPASKYEQGLFPGTINILNQYKHE
ncbi:MAG: hypothetical protein CVV02_18505 [Firmicutes bacterium HGW-Firmicutes-7]|nr:MAG: hypothetical protein CVV02_18505 [Firmicutes bacterium HGW-Firmicutes-7]